MNKEFKIGDEVIDIISGKRCEIIADKQTPYRHDFTGDVYPLQGTDFVLRECVIPAGEFRAFIYSPKHHLRTIQL